jgi:hypothetical protein
MLRLAFFWHVIWEILYLVDFKGRRLIFIKLNRCYNKSMQLHVETAETSQNLLEDWKMKKPCVDVTGCMSSEY